MNDTQKIKDRIDLAQLIGEYIPIKKAGINWKAPCPFHHEKTPSFMVHPEKQIWHCFGCGKGGDVFTFIQEIEGFDFIEALKFLAKRAGIELDFSKQSMVDSSLRNRVQDINVKAAAFFNHILINHPAGKIARDYLANRGVTASSITNWQIGFVPDQWNLLTKYFLNKGVGIDDLVASGLIIKKEGADTTRGVGVYDRFRGRIMFPICDAHGSVVGFTGRILVETENSGGKYVNTPQTVLYDKSKVLYGLNKAKAEIKTKDLVVLVEGQMDVIACHQAGMTNVVAASGTALTFEQVKLLKRYTNNVAMAFDADAAGQNAGKRGSEIALEAGMRVRVIEIPKGFAKDADECLKKDPAVWFKAVAEASELMEWYFRTVCREKRGTTPVEKQKIVDELAPQIARIPYAVERESWLKRLGDEIGIGVDVLRAELKQKHKILPKNNFQSVAPSTLEKLEQLDSLWQEFWSILFKFPGCYRVVRSHLKPMFAESSIFSGLYEICEKMYNTNQSLSLEELRNLLAREGKENEIDVLLLRPYKNVSELGQKEAELELVQLAERIRGEWRKKRGQEIQRGILAAERSGNKDSVSALLVELENLSLQ